MSTGLVYERACLEHDNGSMVLHERARSWLHVAHAEHPERVSATHDLLRNSGVLTHLEQIPARHATEEELRLVHTAEHVAAIEEAAGTDEVRWVGPEARVAPRAGKPLSSPSEGCSRPWTAWSREISTTPTCCSGHPGIMPRPRPPWASACSTPSRSQRVTRSNPLGLGRVAILDWDVHHGNGTQDVFFDDPSVLFVSLHQDGLCPPESGTLAEIGHAKGEGYNLNLPLPAVTGDPGYERALEVVVEPTIRQFGPDVILISAGQDPAASDPLGRMSVTTEGFRALAARTKSLAEQLCEGRVVAFQEGGYSLAHTPFCTLAIIEALAGLPPSFRADPLELDAPATMGGAQRAAIERAARAYSHWWPL